METEQVNLRMPKELVHDIELVSRALKVNKSDWVKTKLAEKVHEEKNRLLFELSTMFAKGLVTEEGVALLAGKEIAGEMALIKGKAKDSLSRGSQYGKRFKGKIPL